MTFHANHIVGVLMTHEQFKCRAAVRAVVLVQGHRKLPPVFGNSNVIIDIVLSGSLYVKVFYIENRVSQKSSNVLPSPKRKSEALRAPARSASLFLFFLLPPQAASLS
jgi:hypothetical protein